jgi:molybdopterin-dependent oxidoreductase-like protein protein/molybdenum-dependent oxidoreductase-like protein
LAMLAGRLMWALCGMASAAVAIGVGEIVAALLASGSIIASVGTLVISLQPPGGKDLFVALFGTNDKLALEIGTAIGGVLVGGLLGVLARRNLRIGLAGFAAFGIVAFLLLQRDPLADQTGSAITAGVAVAAGMTMLMWLGSLLGGPQRVAARPIVTAGPTSRAIGMDRRGFLGLAVVFVAVGGVLAVIGRFLGSQVSAVTPPVAIPSPGASVPPPLAGSDFAIAGLTPIVVPNADFYRIDTRLSVPRLDATTWSLRIHGMVDKEVTLTYSDLLAMPLVERYVTIACVSNEVGGYLVGNAKWTGVKLMPVLESAGIQAGATQVVGRSFDGWTSGFPTEHLSGAGSEAMIVVGMNGEPLPAPHGYPARLIVPGLFGYVSATKWITEIELTTLEAFDAYWVPLGWAKLGPILTQSRIDLPRPGANVPAGPVQVAGIAWAPTRGISKVEVLMDGADWREAELSVPLSTASWVQWKVTLDAPAGTRTLEVRATDGTGETQPADRTPPAPDGARGYHTVRFTAT